MFSLTGNLDHVKKRTQSTSIFKRIAIGNSIIIIIGAVVGTLLTRQLTYLAADVWLIVLFAALGIILSVSINFVIVSTAMRPLRELRQYVDGVQPQQRLTGIQIERAPQYLKEADPDIGKLTLALDSMIDRLEESNQKLRALTERAIKAQEEERKRIARSLHDETGQALSILIINLERLEKSIPKNNHELKTRIEEARNLSSHSLDELRKIIYNLRPTILDDLGLIPAIRWYARTNLERSAILVEFNFPSDDLKLSPHLNTTLFRITQEAVNNILFVLPRG